MTEPPNKPQAFTPAMLAERWGCSERHIRKMISTGDLPAFRVGKLLRVRRDVVEGLDPAQERDRETKMPSKTADAFAYPPRGMSREEAARYIGVGTTKFDEMVADESMPKPKRIDGRVIWDRIALDAAFSDLPHDGGNVIDELMSCGRPR